MFVDSEKFTVESFANLVPERQDQWWAGTENLGLPLGGTQRGSGKFELPACPFDNFFVAMSEHRVPAPLKKKEHRMYPMLFGCVGATGFEPATSWSQTKRSSRAELRPDVLG
jgi:hypothetical protein